MFRVLSKALASQSALTASRTATAATSARAAACALFSSSASYTAGGLPTSVDPNRKVGEKQDKLLFTPGPLTTSWTVKHAATRDFGSRDIEFIKVIREVREGLLEVAGVDKSQWTTCLMQGSGTFGVESTIAGAVPKKCGFLLVANGAYGMRMKLIADAHGIPVTVVKCGDNEHPSLAAIEEALKKNPQHTHVAMVHSETTSGIVNDVTPVGKLAHKYGKTFIVDAMSSFGGVPLDLEEAKISYIVSSANKCLEGIPGFSFILMRKSALEEAKKNKCDSLALDFVKQIEGLDKDGQFRFTPPTHALLAFHQALKEIKLEGGVKARSERYKKNQQTLMKGLAPLGFKLYLTPETQGYIISSYRWATDPNWDFVKFYSKLAERQFVIYPGKVSDADCFRIGHIGRIFPEDTNRLVKAIEEVCKEMKTASFYKA